MKFENRVEKVCFFLFCFNFFFMIRGYFVANIIESCLLVCLCSQSALRIRFFNSLLSFSFLPVGLFLAWIFITGFWGNFGWESFNDFLSWRKLLILAFGLVLLDSREKLIFLIKVILSTGAIFLVLILISFSMSIEILDRDWNKVVQNHTAQGIFLIYIATMLVFLHIFSWRQKSSLVRDLSVGFIVVTCVVITMSSSGRGGIVLLVSFLLIGCWYASREAEFQSPRVAVGLVILSLVVVMGSLIGNPRIEAGITNALGAFDSDVNSSMGIRVVMWANTLKLISENIFLGSGSGAFAAAYDQVTVSDGSWRAFSTDNPHQQFLHIWAEYGLVGLLLLLFWFWRLVQMGGSTGGVSRLVIVFSVVAIVVLGMFNGVLGSFVEGRIILYGLVIGVFLARKNHNSEVRHDC